VCSVGDFRRWLFLDESLSIRPFAIVMIPSPLASDVCPCSVCCNSLVLQWTRSIVSLPTRVSGARTKKAVCIFEILSHLSFLSGCAVHRCFHGGEAVGDCDGVHWRGIPQDLHRAAEGKEAAAAAGRQHDARRGAGHGVSYPYQQMQSATLFVDAVEQNENDTRGCSGLVSANSASRSPRANKLMSIFGRPVNPPHHGGRVVCALYKK
jgi:hypothetical protein